MLNISSMSISWLYLIPIMVGYVYNYKSEYVRRKYS